jgi:hypothetical protein
LPGIGSTKLREPVVIGPKDRRQQRTIGNAKEKQTIRGVEHASGNAIDGHIFDVLMGIPPTRPDVLVTPTKGDVLRRLEAHPGLRHQADRPDFLVPLDDPLIVLAVSDDTRGALAESGVDSGGPQVGRLEDV